VVYFEMGLKRIVLNQSLRNGNPTSTADIMGTISTIHNPICPAPLTSKESGKVPEGTVAYHLYETKAQNISSNDSIKNKDKKKFYFLIKDGYIAGKMPEYLSRELGNFGISFRRTWKTRPFF
jgi:hypothetical protein